MFDRDATHITLIGSHLAARMPDRDGMMRNAEMDLNECIGDNDGAPIPLPLTIPHPTRIPQTDVRTLLTAMRQ